MPQIRRSDGVQFVVQSYRELLDLKQISALKREIRQLAKKQGDNICVFKRDNGKFEIVFSRDSGFLLGETVWNYFNKPTNLIYCEALPENGNILLVVVKDGSVYLDTKILSSKLSEELAFLATSNDKYDVYVYGDVPISEASAEVSGEPAAVVAGAVGGTVSGGAATVASKSEMFILDKALVNSFNVLKAPIFPSLALDSSLQLLPLELALTASYFRNKFIRMTALVAAVLIVFCCGYWIFSPSSSTEQSKQSTDPYELYNRDLATPSPDQQLTELNRIIVNFMALAGWDLSSLDYKDGTYTAHAKLAENIISGGSNSGMALDVLHRWMKMYGVSMSGNGGTSEVTLSVLSTLNNRVVPKNIYNLDSMVAMLTNKLALVVAKENIKINKVDRYQKIKSLELEIGFKDFSPLTFDLIGKLLAGFPLHIISISTSVSEGLFSGSIKLIIWGN